MVLFLGRFKKLPALVAVGSFSLLMGVVLLTNPMENIGAIFAFYALFFTFLLATGSLFMGSYRKYRLVILATFIVLLLMFGSNKSLGLVDILIMVLTFVGLYFYFSRKT